MSHRADIAAALAPVSPPCFESRVSWLEYVRAAADDVPKAHRPRAYPLVFLKPPVAVQFNTNFNFCSGCLDEHKAAMRAQDRCQPSALIRRAEAAKDAANGKA